MNGSRSISTFSPPPAWALTPAAQADRGNDVVARLNQLYNDTRQDCGGPSKPAFLCSGVLFRATWPSTDYMFYSISPKSQKSGGVSASLPAQGRQVPQARLWPEEWLHLRHHLR